VVLIGRDAPALRATLAGTGVPLADHATLEGAVRAAASSPSRRRGAAVAGLRQPRHVPQLRPSRPGVPRARWKKSPRPERRHELADRLVSASTSARTGGNAAGGRAASATRARGRPRERRQRRAAEPLADARLRPLAAVGRDRAARARRGDGLFGIDRAARLAEIRAIAITHS
jgi:hypothetical protein